MAGLVEFVGEDEEELSVVPGDQLIVLGEVDGWLQVGPRAEGAAFVA